MRDRGTIDLPATHPADILVDRRRILLILVLVLSVCCAWSATNLEGDPSLKSMFDSTSPRYQLWQELLQVFGNDEALVVAITYQASVRDEAVLRSVDRITRSLQGLGKVSGVVSITNMEFLMDRGGEIGNYPLVQRKSDELIFPDEATVRALRKALPTADLLVSTDMKTVGLLVTVDDRWREDLNVSQTIVSEIDTVVRKEILPGADFRVVGPSIIRYALQKYSRQSALIFGMLCALICTVVTIYVFKSLKVTLVTGFILGLSALWTAGLMSWLRIPLNPTTSSAFGLILITSLETVIHIVVRFNQFRLVNANRLAAVRETVRFLARPCLMCAGTTAVGFGSCMVSQVPMVFQLGLIMSVGTLISSGLALIITPSLIASTRTLDTELSGSGIGDRLSPLLEKVKASIANHYRFYTVAGFAIAAFMLAGAPLIRTDQQLLHFLGDSARETKDIRFVEDKLGSLRSVELVLESDNPAFKRTDMWQRVMTLEQRLQQLPQLGGTESILPFLGHAQSLFGGRTSNPGDLFSRAGTIPQLLFLTSLSREGKQMLRRYVAEDYHKIRIVVRLKSLPTLSVADTVDQVRSLAEEVMDGKAKAIVTGGLAVFASQGQDFVRSEIQSMVLALGIITILLMIQMGTPQFGLVSLIPNIPPIATVFGIMGWVGICLDGATIFGATVAVGLAVDNTIHYMAQLKREIRLNPELGVQACVFRAYTLAAKPMAAWSLVTLLGFLSLTATPFRASHNFGILVSAAIFMGMFGDLVFMQSMILSFAWIRKLIRKLIDREIDTRVSPR